MIDLFEAGPVTIRMIMQKMGCCRQVAHVWLNRASLHLPIYETGSINYEGPGKPATVYELVK